MHVQITSQSFADLLDQADSKGQEYSFIRKSPGVLNQLSCVELRSPELGITVRIEHLGTTSYFLEI
jgi:hypothetical protein